jgi:hypothetical protein
MSTSTPRVFNLAALWGIGSGTSDISERLTSLSFSISTNKSRCAKSKALETKLFQTGIAIFIATTFQMLLMQTVCQECWQRGKRTLTPTAKGITKTRRYLMLPKITHRDCNLQFPTVIYRCNMQPTIAWAYAVLWIGHIEVF